MEKEEREEKEKEEVGRGEKETEKRTNSGTISNCRGKKKSSRIDPKFLPE